MTVAIVYQDVYKRQVDTVSVQPVVKDTVVPASSDTVSAVVTPVEQPKELTLKEIEELRKLSLIHIST